MITQKEWVKQFTIALKKQMRKNNFTQRELAEKCNIKEATLSRYINGDRIPRATVIVTLANELNCKCDELCLFDGNKQH